MIKKVAILLILLIVSTSIYDAEPRILYEASAMKCNIIASKNCGNWKICNDQLLVEPFYLYNYLEKIDLSLTRKFDDNINYFLDVNAYQKLIEIISIF